VVGVEPTLPKEHDFESCRFYQKALARGIFDIISHYGLAWRKIRILDVTIVYKFELRKATEIIKKTAVIAAFLLSYLVL